MIIKKCEICGNKLKTQPSRISIGRGRFCSQQCTGKYRSTLRGEKNPCWRGGRVKYGEYWFLYKPDHPHCRNNKYVQEHRLVMEKKIGRYLKPDELVHHINHIKTDNRIENLEIIDKSNHHKHHSKGENNPMYGITRDYGLGHFKVKIPLLEINKYRNDDFIDLPFKVIQKYLNNIRDIPVNGKPWNRTV
jgi:hypothetical protein